MVRISSALLQEAKTTGAILSTEALAREKQVFMWARRTSLCRVSFTSIAGSGMPGNIGSVDTLHQLQSHQKVPVIAHLNYLLRLLTSVTEH